MRVGIAPISNVTLVTSQGYYQYRMYKGHTVTTQWVSFDDVVWC